MTKTELAGASTDTRLEELSELLRRLARNALSRILGSGAAVSAPLEPEQFGPLYWAFPLDPGRYRTWTYAERRTGRAFLVTDPPRWSNSQSIWLADSIVIPRTLKVLEWLVHLLGKPRIARHAEIPHFVSAIAADAWSQFEFHNQVVAEMWGVLRREVILYPYKETYPQLSDTFWWLAIATEVRKAARDAGHDDAPRQLADRIDKYAEAAMAESGWAGFWDQCLIRRGFANGVHFPVDLKELPLIANGRDDELSTFARNAVVKDWQSAAPDFGERLLAGLP